MRGIALILVVAACGKSDPLCTAAVHKVFEMTLAGGPPGSEPKADEKAVIDQIETQTLSRCNAEGLSKEVADCILATHAPDWDDQLRACPAFMAKPPSWVIMRPPAAEREKLLKRADPSR